MPETRATAAVSLEKGLTEGQTEPERNPTNRNGFLAGQPEDLPAIPFKLDEIYDVSRFHCVSVEDMIKEVDVDGDGRIDFYGKPLLRVRSPFIPRPPPLESF